MDAAASEICETIASHLLAYETTKAALRQLQPGNSDRAALAQFEQLTDASLPE